MSHMDRPPKYQLIEMKLGRDLAGYINARREEGDSFDTIARELWGKTGIPVTRQTVLTWGNLAPN